MHVKPNLCVRVSNGPIDGLHDIPMHLVSNNWFLRVLGRKRTGLMCPYLLSPNFGGPLTCICMMISKGQLHKTSIKYSEKKMCLFTNEYFPLWGGALWTVGCYKVANGSSLGPIHLSKCQENLKNLWKIFGQHWWLCLNVLFNFAIFS